MINRSWIWRLAIVAAATIGSPAAARDLQKNYDALVAAQNAAMNRPEAERGALLAASYREHFGALAGSDLAGLSDTSLDLLFRAAEITAGYTLDACYVEQMALAYGELTARARADLRHRRSLFEAWVMVRRFAQARQLSAVTPDAGRLPVLREAPLAADTPAVWALAEDGNALVHQAVDLQRTRIVVVSHPACSFSQRAAQSIAADPQLGPAFAQLSLWLLPQTATIDVDQVQAWQRAHTPYPMVYVDRQQQWPMIDYWGTPTFYFIRNGVLLHKVVGWPSGGHSAELLEGLTRLQAASAVSPAAP